MKKYYTYDDVFLIPQFTDLNSRSEASTKCKLFDLELNTPFISANMDTITGPAMAEAMWHDEGGIGALHRFNSIKKACLDYTRVIEAHAQCLVSIGVNKDFKERALALHYAGARHFVVDIAHGHSEQMKKTLGWLKNKWNDVHIIAGNVATPKAVLDLARWGADIIKVGIGPGACCKTRVVTGHGIPQFSAVLECAAAAKSRNIQIIADGGIRYSGDIVKAFAAGADFVMIGSLLAGTDETPGNIVTKTNGSTTERMKAYRGMASDAARESRELEYSYVPAAEGIQTLVPCKGPVKHILVQLQKGLQSGMSYCNARELDEINDAAIWDVQTQSGYSEGRPHILDKK